MEGTQVGGDWYDVIALGGERVALVIGDVMGRGVRAASVMGQLRATTRAYARLDLPPAQVLRLLDRAVRDIGDVMIVTCVYAVHDPVRRRPDLRQRRAPAAAAGPARRQRAPPARGRPAARHRLRHTRPGRGAGGARTRCWSLYTDGLVEHRGSDIDEGIDTLAGLLAREDVRTAPVGSIPGRVLPVLVPDGPDDDVALLVARVVPAGAAAPELRWSASEDAGAVRGARTAAEQALVQWGLSAIEDDVALVVSELVTNAVTHARLPVELRLRPSPESLRIEVQDCSADVPTRVDAGIEDDHGRGLQIVAAVAERWGTEPAGSGKVVWCELAVPSGAH